MPVTSTKISLNNLRTGDESLINLMLTAKAGAPYLGNLILGQSMTLKAFKTAYPDMSFAISYITAGRLYVSYGALPAAPVPNGPQYYGWIELTKEQTDPCVWINLSNVDVVGLPLALAGTTVAGDAWSLGYNQPITTLISTLQTTALTGPSSQAAVITCSTSKPGYSPTKIVAPNSCPASYASYHSYIASLRSTSASVSITTDTPAGGVTKVFTGNFVPVPTDTVDVPTNAAISLTSGQGDTFQVLIGQLTTAIAYRCDGGTLLYNNATVAQNQTATPLTADEIYANSTFRNLMLGINEGYFSTTGQNDSANFPYLSPFQGGQGSAYAQVIHTNSNSYGFPYADSNLKVLITAALTGTLTLTIMTDDAAYGYAATPPGNGNQPLSGAYQFGIGTGSQALGNITIGNCTYPPTALGAYGGYLPTLSQWTKMHFSGPGEFIWFKTTGAGFLAGTDCFDCNGTPFTGSIAFDASLVATWPAQVSWNPAKTSPTMPTT